MRTRELRYAVEIPPPDFFKGRRRLVMDPLDVPVDSDVVQTVARHYQTVTGQPAKAIGTVLPFSYTADDTCHLWKAGIPCLLYGPGVIKGSADEDDSCVLIRDMVKVTKVLALTALDVCSAGACLISRYAEGVDAAQIRPWRRRLAVRRRPMAPKDPTYELGTSRLRTPTRGDLRA